VINRINKGRVGVLVQRHITTASAARVLFAVCSLLDRGDKRFLSGCRIEPVLESSFSAPLRCRTSRLSHKKQLGSAAGEIDQKRSTARIYRPGG